jgi:cyclophilin family peptidyl-prolyl cis-trans isomerase
MLTFTPLIVFISMSIIMKMSKTSFRIFYFLLAGWIVQITSCVPPADNLSTELHLGFQDPTIKLIAEYQDQGKVDSLYKYLKNPLPGVRYAAVKAFASINQVDNLDPVVAMMEDPVIEIRAMAAFALGQIGSPNAETALISAFKTRDTLNVNNILNQNILEALGKCGSQTTLKNIASVSTYATRDHQLVLGQIRALYRFGQRGMFDDGARDVAIKYATSELYPKNIQRMAANYLSRFKELDLKGSHDMLLSKIDSEVDPFSKMCLVNAVGRNPSFDLTQKLLSVYNSEKDYRVKANIIRAWGNGDIDTIKSNLSTIIKDPSNIHLASLAAEVIGKKGNKDHLLEYKSLITPDMDWRVKTKLYHSLMKVSPLFFTKFKTELATEIYNLYMASSNSYERAGYIAALGQDPYQYLTLGSLRAKANSPVEKSTLAESIGGIMTHPEFFKAFGSKYGQVKQYIINYLIEGCKEGDAGVVAVAGSVLKNPEVAAKEYIGDSTWYQTTIGRLKMPRDIEAYNEISEAKMIFDGKPIVKYKSPYNHPININTIIEQSKDTVNVVMKTTKGNITMNLYCKKAPGSVANFLELSKRDFYDNKVFHRVVPNFVVQAGCPRGDGYGADDYTIRSELNDSYYDNEGYVGMASAGRNTEGTQFFITHSPAPHLDGNYTTFGKVVEGMDVVHNLLVGDKILDVIILK